MGKRSIGKKQSKAAQIRALLAQGKTPQEAAKSMGVKPQYVYSVQYYEKKKALAAAPKRKPGRPKKVRFETAPISIDVTKEPPYVGEWTVTAKYDAPPVPRLTWRQRLRALFTGRV